MTRTVKLSLLAFLTLLSVAGVLLLDPIPQDPGYHRFADQRSMLSVANFLNVASNLPFVLVGLAGLLTLHWYPPPGSLKPAYMVLFLGIALTGIGSAYYHLAPDNPRLVWDRLPMTLVFMAFLPAVIAERIHLKAGALLLWPLLAAGIASVWWWHHTEQQGAGDLRAYALVQFYPMLFIPLIMLLFKAPKPDASLRLLAYVIGLYTIAKVCEHFDEQILDATGFVSGHSLKHLFAAAATWFIVLLYRKRYEEQKGNQKVA